MRRAGLAVHARVSVAEVAKAAADNVAGISHRRRVNRDVSRRFDRNASVLRQSDERINGLIQEAADVETVGLIELAP